MPYFHSEAVSQASRPVNVLQSGAKGDDATDDTAAIQSALNTGKSVFFPVGKYIVSSPLVVNEVGQRIFGCGDVSTIKAGASIAAVLQVASVGGGRAVIEGLKFDGNGNATNAVTQSIASETSVGTRWVRCKFRGATGYQMVNTGCEDVTYLDCATDGDESSPLSVPNALQVSVPSGAVRIFGGEWFGRCELAYQQVTVEGAVIGPIVIDNPGASNVTILGMRGCYLYDGGAANDNCINTYNNLGNLNLAGCYLVAQDQVNYINGNMAGGVTVRVEDCIFVQTKANQTSYILQASGSGRLVIDGGSGSLGSGGTLHAFNAVSGATTAVTTLIPCNNTT